MDCLSVFNSLEGFETRIVERKGRFPEEVNYEVYVGREGVWVRLLAVKMFKGRPPFYRRWVELFHILPEVSVKGLKYVFLNSLQERELVKCLSSQLSGGEKIFIEYIYDGETYKALEAGIPAPLTRLGYMLFENGFTWFKNWYFAEGFMEGSPKIQGEKPLDENNRMRLLQEICGEVEGFLKTAEDSVKSETQDYYVRAVERALKIKRECAEQ